MYAQLPDRVLLDAGVEYEAEIRTLLESRDYPVRHAAAWALWNLLRDPGALSIFLKDAGSADAATKASSLFVLQAIRHEPSAPLFLPMLRESSPGLRQVGLLGVQAFEIRGSLPEVENLVTDRDGAVAQVAVTTLGVLHPPEARSLLLALVSEDGPLAYTATQALASYRSPSDVDFFVARLSPSDATEREKEALTGILSKITGHPSLQWWSDYFATGPKPQNLDAATIADWTTWWKRHRGQAAGERQKDVLASLVEGVLREKDEARRMRLARQIGSYFPNLPYPVAEWWQAHKNESAWAIMTSADADPLFNITLLMEIDQSKARQLLFSTFMRRARGEVLSFQRYQGSESNYQLLVRMSGVDFGDPLVAQCGARDQILTNWEEWARKEGWAQ
jgi:HEAT repeat protein